MTDRSKSDGGSDTRHESGDGGGVEGHLDDTGLNLATVWETVAATVPEQLALVHGDSRRTWGEFESRASRLAHLLDEHGIGHGDNVALYLYNCSEYLEATFAAFKVRAATVNVNYRYVESELLYLFDNSDAKAVVFDVRFADLLGALRPHLPKVDVYICVGSTLETPTPQWALDYDAIIDTHVELPAVTRSDQDLWILYTGGTTGRPKGVMWPHRSLLGTAKASYAVIKSPVPTTVSEVEHGARQFAELGKQVVLLPAAPLMHGTSALTSLAVLSTGGAVVTLCGTSFDAVEMWTALEANAVTQLTIVGDAFAVPMVRALTDAADAGNPFDLSSLKVVLSSGVMWSKESKAELHGWTAATFADSLGSSEGVGFATSVARRGKPAETARFVLGPDAAVFTEDGTRVAAGSGDRGLLAVGGPIPIGYYNDPIKSVETFRTFEGRVWSVPGDWATVELDGTIRLLGRGSACINTAGEKVYPEEVEEILKLHPWVRDANVVGIPDPKWGTAVHAVVSLRSEAEPSDEQGSIETTLRTHCKDNLAGYKCPKVIHVVTEVQRGPNGKPDYRWATEIAQQSY